MASHAFQNITHPDNTYAKGSLKISSDGLSWKDKSDDTVTIKSSTITGAEWIVLLFDCRLKVIVSSEDSKTFRGFQKKDFETLQSSFLSLFNIEMKNTTISVVGQNWGDLSFEGKSVLKFETGGKAEGGKSNQNNNNNNQQRGTAFELSLGDIAQVVLQPKSKNEIAVEMHAAETGKPEDEELTEIRFYVPTRSADPPDAEPPAKRLHTEITSRGGIDANASSIVVNFADLNFHTPRGRYHVDMYSNFLRLHGRSYEYRIRYASIVQLYKLPRIDLPQDVVVIVLNPPARQGNTTYPYLIITFPRDQTLQIDIKMDEQEIKEKFGGQVQKHLEGASADVVALLLRTFSGKRLISTTPYESPRQESALRCSLKQNEGQLFPLEKRFLFLFKPVVVIRYSEVQSVRFDRVQASDRTHFDLVVNGKDGTSFQFSNIYRAEYDPLVAFIKEKDLVVENLARAPTKATVDIDDDSDESDDNFDPTGGAASDASPSSSSAGSAAGSE